MKYILSFFLIVSLLTGLTGCRLNNMEPEEIAGFGDDVAENIGDSQITDDEKVLIERMGGRILARYKGMICGICFAMAVREDTVISGNVQSSANMVKAFNTW